MSQKFVNCKGQSEYRGSGFGQKFEIGGGFCLKGFPNISWQKVYRKAWFRNAPSGSVRWAITTRISTSSIIGSTGVLTMVSSWRLTSSSIKCAMISDDWSMTICAQRSTWCATPSWITSVERSTSPAVNRVISIFNFTQFSNLTKRIRRVPAYSRELFFGNSAWISPWLWEWRRSLLTDRSDDWSLLESRYLLCDL